MPVPASDAIASDIGHGALGVRYGLRPFRDLLSETVGQRHLYVELRPKLLLATWTSDGGGLYHKSVAETFDGIVLDVAGVQTSTEQLGRVESVALCTAGHYYWTGAVLYIHLTAGADPAATVVVAQLGIHVGSHGICQPVLAPDRLANGNLELWTGPVPDAWLHNISASAGAITLDKTTVDALEGSYAARFAFAAGTGYGVLYQDFTTLAAGALYRASGAYRVTSGAAVTMSLYVDDTVASALGPNGRDIVATAPVFSDTEATGEWRRFFFDFLCPSWATVRVLVEATGTLQTGAVDFDDVKLQHIPRFVYYEPLLSIDSLPTIEAARSDAFWGPMSSALGGLTLLNRGLTTARLEALLAKYDWLGADAIVRVGGRYQLGGNEILFEDCPVIATGKLGAPTVTDGRATFDLEDDRKLLLQTLPTRTYNNNGVDAYTQPDRGRSRALLFGAKTGIRPVQYGIDTTLGGPVPLGKYEVVDCTDWPTPGLYSAAEPRFTLHFYADEDAAKIRSSARRFTVLSTDVSDSITYAPATGRFTMLRDLRPLVITLENNKLAFNIGGPTLIAQVTPGIYPMRNYNGTVEQGLIKAVADAMNAAAGTADITCTFTDATQKVNIAKGAGTLNLLCKTGAQTQTSLWSLLGFDAATDKTLDLNYNADAVYTSEACDQVIRVDATGFKDDASGTYTGTAGATIEKAADIAHFILRVLFGLPASAITVATFVSARFGSPPCSLYIGSPGTMGNTLEEIETAGKMDVMFNGGLWSCRRRDIHPSWNAVALLDSDYLSFEASYDPDDLYGTVTLLYNESPDNPEPVKGGNRPWSPNAATEMGEVINAAVALRHGRANQRTFKACLRDEVDAAYPIAGSLLEWIATEAGTKRRRFRIRVKGKALLLGVEGYLSLTRARGLDPTGAISDLIVRAISKRDDWAGWISDILAVEVIQ